MIMTLFSLAFISVGSICFTLGCLHLLIFIRRQDLKVDLVFSLVAFAFSLSSFFEIWAFKADTLAKYLPLLKATLLVQCVLWICFAWFVHFFTRSVKLWPVILISFLYTLAIIINILSPASILFSEITEFSFLTFQSGEKIYFVNGPSNTFRFLGDLAWIILLIYTLFACIAFGRKGNVRQSIIFGTTVFLCIGLGYLHGTLIDIGVAEPPYLGSFLFLPLALLMSYLLAEDVLRASYLSSEIKAAELRWRNLLENVHLIVLGIDNDKTVSYVNPYFLELTGYEKSDVLNRQFVDLIPENKRQEISGRLKEIIESESTILKERSVPILTRSGEQREILWSNVLNQNSGGEIIGILSIGRDMTKQIEAELSREQAIQELEEFKEKLEIENISLKEIIQEDHGFKEFVGTSNAIRYVQTRIIQVAPTDAMVLIQGETGVGKELVAHAIHNKSNRSGKSFIKLNCAAIPATLVESELFGHERGAFTDAKQQRKGRFELADKGTLFLDEISELTQDTQAKLLRILQDGEFERIGGTRTLKVDVRIIAATNRDLNIEVAEGRFRADLFYRLNVYPITVPPLRKRRGDIPLLVEHFISLISPQLVKKIDKIPKQTMDKLKAYNWPGNIRELRNVVERSIITSPDSTLRVSDELVASQHHSPLASAPPISLDEVQRLHILAILKQTDGKIEGTDGAAEILQLKPSTLRHRMKKLGIER